MITLYRPVGQMELDLIKQSNYKNFPPRLEWQPIFYPVMNQAYAAQIALEWNTKDEFSGFAGYVTAFDLPENYLKKFPVQNVGGNIHNELWVPAGELEEFNNNIIGRIRVVESFYGEKYKAEKMEHQLKHISKLMSLVLRHKPEEIGLQLDENGWANVHDLIDKINKKGINVDFETIDIVVETNDKKRFAFNDDKTLIRASQGHSIEVELNLKEMPAPDILYHGTAIKFLESILQTGLQKQNRQYVHLSETIETAKAVGSRHGKPVILTVHSKAMQEAGIKFYLSENKVWLTESVPIQYISQ